VAWSAVSAAEAANSPVSPQAISPRFTGAPFLRTWTSEDYGAAPVNWAFVQHPHNGFIYVGNNYGVLEFDGAAWHLYPLPAEGAARTLAIDRAGTVWAGGVGGVATLQPDATGVLRSVDVTARIPATDRVLGDFNYSYVGPDGVYFSTVRDLVRFAADGTARRWAIPGRANGLFWHADALHVSAGTGGLLRLDGDRLVPAAPAPVVPGESGRATIRVMGARPVSADATLLLTARGPQLWRGVGTALVPLSPTSPSFFSDDAATAAAFLPDGRFAFSFLRHGLRILDARGETAVALDQSHGLPSNRIEEIATDREGGLWIAQRTGLVRLQLDSGFAQHGPALGLSGSPRVFFRFGDRLYVTHNEGLAWRDEATGRFNSVEGVTAGLNTLLEADGRLYGTGSNLYEITRDDRARVALPLGLTTLHRLRQYPGYYLGGSQSGAWLLQSADGTWQNLGALARVPVGLTRFRDDGDGTVWAVGYDGRGVWRLDFRGGPRPDAPAQTYDEARGVPAVRRRDSARFVSRGDELYVTCAVWTLRFNRAADRFEPVADLAGLRGDNGAVAAHIDTQGAHWWFLINPSPRLVRLAPDTTPPWRPTEIPTGPLRAIVPNSLYFDEPTQNLWVAGQGSIITLDPAWQPSQPRPPLRAFVRSLATAKGEILFGNPGLDRTPPPPLALLPTQNALRFAFAAPAYEGDFNGKTTTRYRTRLTGLETDWSDWSDGTSREFTHLPYRSFAFEVQAQALDGRESEIVALAFSIAAPWWLTRWAFAGYVASFLAAIFAAISLRTRTLRRRSAHLETIVAERTAELARLRQIDRDESAAAKLAEEKTRLEMLRYQLNPHFLYNALNSIRALIFSRPPAAGDMVSQLADLCRVTLTRNEDLAPVSEEFAMLKLYLDMEQTRWRDKLAVEIDLAPDAAPLLIPPFLLLPLVENALKHGWQPEVRTLRLRLSARITAPATLVLEVANTGHWLAHGESAAPSTGIGLENLRQRLRRYYPDTHSFVTAERDSWVIVSLALPAVPTRKS
jgi:hypothetical protein